MNMIINLASDWADYDTGEVSGAQVNEYIDELNDTRAGCEEEGGQLPTEEAAVLRALLAFRAEVTRLAGDFEAATIVPDAEFDKHVRHWAEEEHGLGEDSLSGYVDWQAYAKDQQGWFSKVQVDGQTVWVKRP